MNRTEYNMEKVGKGGLYVYIRAPHNSAEYMKLEKLILEKIKIKFRKMKMTKINPYTPYIPTLKKNQ